MARVPLLLGALTFVVLAGCGSPQQAVTELPPEITYLSRADWGANDPVLEMQAHEPSRITIHHTAVRQNPDQTLTQKMRGLQEFSQTRSELADGRIKEPWADIPYHFYVDLHGVVAEGRSLRYSGDSNTPYDPSGHILIVLEGNFEEEEVTAEQRQTLDRLVQHFGARYDVPAERLASHKDFADTLCPGENLYDELPRLRALLD